MSASFRQDVDLKGIQVYRFALEPNTLAAPIDNPDNHCFCRDRNVTNNCSLAGALDVSSCLKGTRPRSSRITRLRLRIICIADKPVYISLPHFLYGSPVLRQNVLGLNPNEEHHMTYLDVEPVGSASNANASKLAKNKSDVVVGAFPAGNRLHLGLR